MSDFQKIELPIYSIIKFTELEIISPNEAKLDLMVGSVVIWESVVGSKVVSFLHLQLRL